MGLGDFFGLGKKKGAEKKEGKALGALTPEQIDALPEALLTRLQQPETVAVFGTPDSQTSREQFFRFNGETGIDLKRGQQIGIVIPEGGSMSLQDVFIGHRKREAYWHKNCSPKHMYGVPGWQDKDGAYTEVLVFDGNTNKWRKWKDPKGHDPIKFAEPRATVEYEKLSDYFGMLGEVKPLAFLLISRGQGKNKRNIVTEHSFEMMTYPEMHDGTQSIERAYSPGTTFVDFKKPNGPNRLPRYGGGKKHHKKGPHNTAGGPAGYPGAVPLKGKVGCEPFQMQEVVDNKTEYLDDQGRLWLRLPVGVKLKSLEISAGARWWGSKLPDKSLASKNGRKISAYLVNGQGQKLDHFMRSMNVGPQGVLLGGPTDPDYVTQDGDQILIEGEHHTSYIMGWRILYDDSQGIEASVNTAVDSTEAQVSDTLLELDLDLEATGDHAGTQGGQWHVDKKTGDKYFVKEYHGNLDRCATEFIANSIYAAMGIPAVRTRLHKGKAISKEIDGVKGFKASDKYDKAKVLDFFTHPDVKSGFVIDAWLANWDIFGLDYDNIVKGSGDRMYRVDAGGALFYRGMGQHKAQFGSEEVGEIDTMRNPKAAREAGIIFQNLVTDEDVKNQIQSLAEVMTDEKIKQIVEASGISNTAEIIATLLKRRNWLIKKYNIKTKKAAPTVEKPKATPKTAAAPKEMTLQSTGKQVGSHGIMHVDSTTGKYFIVKEYGANPERCSTEYIANKLYEKMGVPCIDARIVDGKFVSKAVQGLKAVKGLESLKHPDVKDGFVVDAWLANWNVFGLDYENIRARGGRMIRTGNHGSLFFRAQGGAKPGFASPIVTEISTMRNPQLSKEAGAVFSNIISDSDIKKQVEKLQSVMTDEVIREIVESAESSNAEDIIQALIKRRDWLIANHL
ncbi:MAG: hypothetical protein O3B47_01595 [bacterium]|nr:hypothetical protein [bacterium]